MVKSGLKILFLGINFKDWVYETLYYEQQAIKQLLPNSVFYGPGYKYITNNIEEIIEQEFYLSKPDVIFCYIDERRLLGEPLPKEVINKFNISEQLSVFPKGLNKVSIPKIVWINDFWHCSKDEWDSILLNNGFDAVFSTYCPPFCNKEVFNSYFSKNVQDKLFFIPLPRSINTNIFKDYKLDKIYDVALLGAMDKYFYPMRNLMNDLFSRQTDIKYFTKGHPGYRFKNGQNLLIGENYAKLINSSKIFASCTSIFNIPFIKIYEVLACKTALLCDKPIGAEHIGLIDDYNFISVNEKNILDRVYYYLNNIDLLNQIARNGNELFVNEHTVEIRAAEFVKALDSFYNGKVDGKWMNLSPTLNNKSKKYFYETKEVNQMIEKSCHINDITDSYNNDVYEIWLKYGLNNRPNENPPVVTEHPELVIKRGVLLYEIALRINARTLAEVGTARGFQSMLWAKYITDNGIEDGQVYTCDIDAHDAKIYKTPLTDNQVFSRRELWAGNIYADKIIFTEGNSSLMAQNIKSNIDLVYIDGEHTEKDVLFDYYSLKYFFTEDTVIVFDDCDERFPGVQKAVDIIKKQIGNDYYSLLVSFNPAKYKIMILCHKKQFNKIFNNEIFSANIDFLELKNKSMIDFNKDSETDTKLFRNETDLYLASADRMDLTLQNITNFNSIGLKECDVYISVIGGLSGLNYLLEIKPEKIIFYDVNPIALGYVKLIFDIIKISNSNDDFISRVFSRSVSKFINENNIDELNYSNQELYLNREIDKSLLNDTLLKLDSKSQAIYKKHIIPHLQNKILDGVRNCRRLLPCWNKNLRVPVGAGEENGFNEFGSLEPNTNTFFFGDGWLSSKDTFDLVKESLSEAKIQIVKFDLLKDDITNLTTYSNFSVFYYSNIDDWFPIEFKSKMNEVAINIKKNNGFGVFISSMNGVRLVKPEPHTLAFRRIKKFVSGNIIEVSHKVPWGFYEFERINLKYSDYLDKPYSCDTLIIHILIGEGINRSVFAKVLSKAYLESKRIIIIEHNKDSKDWAGSNSSFFVNQNELKGLVEQTLLMKNYSTHFEYIIGETDSKRNMLYVIDNQEEERIYKEKEIEITLIKSEDENKTEKYMKICIFYDEEGWAWWHRGHHIKKYISDRFQIDILKIGSQINHNDYDLLLLFESYLLNQIPANVPDYKIILGSSTLKTLYNSITSYKSGNFAGFVTNNLESYQRLKDTPNTFCCQNGVNEELFYYKYPRTNKITACWVGNSNSMNNKGLDLIKKACELTGIQLLVINKDATRILKESLYTQEQLRDGVYHKADFYICASEMEGTPNPALEALSCGLPVLSTPVGNIPEIIVDGYNGYIIERTLQGLMNGIEKIKKSNIEVMSQNARNSILNGWKWSQQVKKYEEMFDNVFSKAKEISVPDSLKEIDISFIIITNGRNNELISIVIQSIRHQKITNYEIIVIGDYHQTDSIKYIPQIEAAQKGLLGKMRNEGIKQAKFENICMLDDDIILSSNWYEEVVAYGNQFDIVTSHIRLPDGSRYWDYVTKGGPRGHVMLDEDERDERVYMTGGGGWLIKSFIAHKILYNDTLQFNENEDGIFSEMCRNAGFKISHNHKAIVFHSAPAYTSIGRIILKRMMFADQYWVSDKYLKEPVNVLMKEAETAFDNKLFAEWGDIVRYAMEKFPENQQVKDYWNGIKSRFTGILKDEMWFSNGYPKYNISVSIYKYELYLLSKLSITEFDNRFSDLGFDLNEYIKRTEDNYIYLSDDIWNIISSDSNKMTFNLGDRVISSLIYMFHQYFPKYYLIWGGAGDGLLTLAQFYDLKPDSNVVCVANFEKTMVPFLKSFPNLNKVYILPRPENYNLQYMARYILSNLPNCLGFGVTPQMSYEKEWYKGLNIFEKYGISEHPEWAKQFKKDKIANPQVVIAPKGSVFGMPKGKRNIIPTENWTELLNLLINDGIEPVIIGALDEKEMYPAIDNCIDKRSNSFKDQMELIASSDFVIASDSWHKTFSALCGIKTIVFKSIIEGEALSIKDVSENIFLQPWNDITTVKNYNEFLEVYKNISKKIINKPKIISKEPETTIRKEIEIKEVKEVKEELKSKPKLQFEKPKNVNSMSFRFWKRNYESAFLVLIKCPKAIGDALMISALASDLKSKYPKLNIYVSGADIVGEVLKHHKDIEGFLLADSDDEFTIEAMADEVVDYNNIIADLPEYYNGMHFMDILGNIAGFRFEKREILYTIEDTELEWAEKQISGFKANNKLIGVHFKTNKDIKRSYPHGDILIKELIRRNSKYRFLALGVEEHLQESPFVFDCNRKWLSFREQMALAYYCDAFITIDSAFFHTGHNYFKKPTLLICGLTNPNLIGNQENKFHYIRNESLKCLNCYWRIRCKIECMYQLEPSVIADKFLNIMY